MGIVARTASEERRLLHQKLLLYTILGDIK
jgi:hypothetical protein